MKGTISPQLKAILANPATSKAFQQGFFDRDRSKPTSIIDLGNGEKLLGRCPPNEGELVKLRKDP